MAASEAMKPTTRTIPAVIPISFQFVLDADVFSMWIFYGLILIVVTISGCLNLLLQQSSSNEYEITRYGIVM